jgi:DNA-binding response OmpR family regulator
MLARGSVGPSVARPGELVSKLELIARVWPDLVVVEANLTVHVSALRRALRDVSRAQRPPKMDGADISRIDDPCVF